MRASLRPCSLKGSAERCPLAPGRGRGRSLCRAFPWLRDGTHELEGCGDPSAEGQRTQEFPPQVTRAVGSLRPSCWPADSGAVTAKAVASAPAFRRQRGAASLFPHTEKLRRLHYCFHLLAKQAHGPALCTPTLTSRQGAVKQNTRASHPPRQGPWAPAGRGLAALREAVACSPQPDAPAVGCRRALGFGVPQSTLTGRRG